MRVLPLAVAALLAAGCASASAGPGIDSRTVEYLDGEVLLEGRLALPAGLDPAEPRPVVLVVHEWWGRSAHADRTAERLAEEGYVALAVDMYGKGKVTTDRARAGAWAGEFRKDPEAGLRRIDAALDLLRTVPGADLSRTACIGFCFGGTVSLEAAWSGRDFRAVVSFHGNLTTPRPERAAGVKASILVLHGAEDPVVSKEDFDAFHASMRAHGYDWAFVSLGGAVHSFTNPAADGVASAASKYHPVAAARSFDFAEEFLEERLGRCGEEEQDR